MFARLRAALVAAALAGALVVSIPPPPVAAGACDYVACIFTVGVSGNGSGSFRTTNSAHTPNHYIDCQIVNGVKTPDSVCSHTYLNGVDTAQEITIYYEVAAATGSEGCDGSPPTCAPGTQYSSSVMLGSFSINVQFQLLPYTVAVSRSGLGSGLIYSTPTGINCPSLCSADFAYGTALTLTAVPVASYFDHWTGACLGQGSSCHLTVTGPVDTTAIFGVGSPPTPSAPAATPKATAKPTVKPGSSQPVATAALPSIDPGASDVAPSTAIESGPPPSSSSGPSGAAATDPPSTPAAATGSDLTPIALAILGAGLLIAVGIGVAGYSLRRRGAPPPP